MSTMCKLLGANMPRVFQEAGDAAKPLGVASLPVGQGVHTHQLPLLVKDMQQQLSVQVGFCAVVFLNAHLGVERASVAIHRFCSSVTLQLSLAACFCSSEALKLSLATRFCSHTSLL